MGGEGKKENGKRKGLGSAGIEGRGGKKRGMGIAHALCIFGLKVD